MHRSIRRLAIGAVLAGIAATGMPALASAAPTCTYDATSGMARVSDGTTSGNLRLTRFGSLLVVIEEGPETLRFCEGPSGLASVNNTNSVLIQGRAVDSADGYTIDMRDGAFGPGAIQEADGNSEIEIIVSQQNSVDPEISVLGTPQADNLRFGTTGAMVGPDNDVDIRLQRPNGGAIKASAIVVHGGEGADHLSGRAVGNGQTQTLSRVTLLGEGGNDTIADGQAAQDFLSGGAGNDTLSSPNAEHDFLFGGSEFDRAFVTQNDVVAADVEDVVRSR